MMMEMSPAPSVAPLNMKQILATPPPYLVGTQQPATTGSKQSVPFGSNAFTTPMINTLFQATSPKNTKPTATGGSSDRFLDTTRSGIHIARAGGQKLEVTVIDHPKFEGVVVSELGANGAAARNGLKVGDHVVRVNGIRARDHRTAMWLADAADSRIKFSLADSTRTVRLNRAVGDVGLTLVNNTQAGIGVVVVQVARGLAADQAGLEVGHVILAIEGELAFEHRAAIKQLDNSSSVATLTVASRKLTEANVLCQHVGEVPCEVFIVQ